MDEKNIEVVLEAFGNKSLKKKFTAEELRGKSVAEMILTMVNQPWQGEDMVTLQMINKQLKASNGYSPKVYDGSVKQPLKFVPVGRDMPVMPYLQNENQLKIQVVGDHVVGNYRRD